MKKEVKELKNKNTLQLEKEIENLRQEISKTILESKVNPAKDTNLIAKKRKKLALLLTVLTEKKEVEKLKVTKKI